jgi:hypothetical protein
MRLKASLISLAALRSHASSGRDMFSIRKGEKARSVIEMINAKYNKDFKTFKSTLRIKDVHRHFTGVKKLSGHMPSDR